MATVLGLAMGHDGAAALVHRGKLVSAIANERLSRKKKARGITKEMIDYVLDVGGVSLDEVDQVAFTSYWYGKNNFVKILTPNGQQEVVQNLLDLNNLVPCQQFTVCIGGTLKPGFFVHHQLSHCASTFYTSPYERAACFSMDASMYRPEACSLFAYGEGSKLHLFYCPGLMIGNTYNVFTEKLGIGPGLHKAGSTMGLAPYGEILPKARQKWKYYGQSIYSRPFQPWDPAFIDLIWSELSELPPHASLPTEKSDSKPAMDIAASLQFIFEETIVEYATELYDKTKSFNDNRICLSGGSFLNCNANFAVKTRTPFSHVFLFPGCGDDGTAVGAALYTAHHLMGQPRYHYEPRDIAYLGREYPQNAIGDPLDIREVARGISRGKIVAWYQGRSEFGPRALGNRSILADPRRAEMREIINSRIKKREWYRPFAPSVLAEKSKEWCEFEDESPFMLHIAEVKKPDEIPAVTHVDGSTRLQTVARSDNALYYDLIASFEEITGVPVVLNTSLNVNGEPLVETPADALRFYESTETDMLVLGNRMIKKNNWHVEETEDALTFAVAN